jgi:dTDP-glucose pyrophosphorylase
MNLYQIVILAAGKGTRFNEEKEIEKIKKDENQKCSYPLKYNLPCIDKFFHEAIIVTGYLPQKIKKEVSRIKREYRNKKKPLELKIKYVEQKKQLGQAHAIYIAKHKINHNFDFCVVNGDLILEYIGKNYFGEILKEELSTPLVVVSQVKDPWNYGIATIDGEGYIKRIIEKPDKNTRRGNIICDLALKGIYKALSGIYFFNNRIFRAIEQTKPNKEKGGEIFLADTINMMAKKGEKVGVFEIGEPIHLTKRKDLEKLEDRRTEKTN